MIKTINNNIYFADIESLIINDQHLPVLIAYSYKYNTKVFEIDGLNKNSSLSMLKQFFNSLNKISDTKIIFFHNMSNYDGYLILEYLTNENIKYQIINKGNSIYKITILDYKITILDSYLLIPFSLENACIYFNKKYFKSELKFNNLNELNYKSQKNDFITYLINDVLCLEELYYNFLEKIKKIFNLDDINSLTLTSLVHKEFLKVYKKTHKFYTLSDSQDSFIRKSYVGGIVDIYKPAGKRIIELDVNSMYPSVMKDNKFGLNKPKYTKNIQNIKEFCKNYIAFIKCDVKSLKDMRYPTLSIKKDGKLIQPLGEFCGVFYSKEILDCIENNDYEFNPIEGFYFTENEYIFKDFIENLYNIRIQAKNNKDIGLETLIKKCMVSLYGRFGIKLDDDIINLYEYQDIYNIDNIKSIEEFENFALIKHTPDLLTVSLNNKILKPRIDWACIVSSESRILMNKIKRLINIYYSDTDSIYIEKRDLYKISKFVHPTELGKFKIEREFKFIIFIALKTYIGKTTKNNWIFKAKSINLGDLKLKYEDDNIFYKDWFKKFYNKMIEHNDDVINIEIDRYFYKSFKDFSVNKKKINLILNLNYDKRLKIYNKGIWVDTKPITLKTENENDKNFLDFLIEQKKILQDDSIASKYTSFINQYIVENLKENIDEEKIKKSLIDWLDYRISEIKNKLNK